MALERVTDRSDFQMQASYFPATAEVVIALNSKHPEIKIHSFTNYPTKTLPAIPTTKGFTYITRESSQKARITYFPRKQ